MPTYWYPKSYQKPSSEWWPVRSSRPQAFLTSKTDLGDAQWLAMLSRVGESPAHYSPGKMTYDLRRLRLHKLIQRAPRPIVTP